MLDKITAFRNKPSEGSLVFKGERNLTERTAWILQAYNTYIAMSNNALRETSEFHKIEDATNHGSLEDIHNSVHILVGGGGHMSKIEVSAFDPLFWLRKCFFIISNTR